MSKNPYYGRAKKAQDSRRPSNIFSTGADSHDKYTRLIEQGGDFGGFFGRTSAAGERVNLQRAMWLSAVWACISRTSAAIASMPLCVYERQPNGSSVKVLDHDITDLLDCPNQDDTPFEFFEYNTAWILAHGNSYAEKKKIGNRIVSLEPLRADHVRPYRKSSGRLVYRAFHAQRGYPYNMAAGNHDHTYREIPRENILHFRGFGMGGDLGLSAIRHGANAMGLGLAAQKVAGKVFEGGLISSGQIKSDQTLNAQQRTQLKEYLDDFMGSENAFKLLVLEAGLEFEGITLKPQDAQLIETRKYSVEDICRFFGVPPIIIGHASAGQTMWGSGVEAIFLAWMKIGLNPIAQRMEQRINKQVLREMPSPRGRRYYTKFDRDELLAMDSKAKAEFLERLTRSGLMSRNEGRERLDMPRKDQDGADDLFVQSQNQPIDTLGGISNNGQ